MTIREEIEIINNQVKAIAGIRLEMEREFAAPPSIVDYRDPSNKRLQDLCEDIDFDFDTLDIEDIDKLQCMGSERDQILWLEIVRLEREEGA